MAEWGLLSTGFRPKRLEDVKADLEAAFRAVYGPAIVTGADTATGRLIGILAAELALEWEGLQGLYSALYPSTASGEALDGVLELSGLRRLAAEATTVWARLDGTPATVVPVAVQVQHPTTRDKFQRLTADVTLLATAALRADARMVAGGRDAGNTFTVTVDAIPYTRTVVHYPVTATDSPNRRFTIAGDRRPAFPVGSTFEIIGSTSNNGTYTVQLVELIGGATRITVVEVVAAPGAALGSVRENQNTIAFELAALLNAGFAITAVDRAARKFTIAGDQTTRFSVDDGLRVFGSTGNDAVYTVQSRSLVGGATEIIVREEIPNATVDGSIRRGWTADGSTVPGTCRLDVGFPVTATRTDTYTVSVAVSVGGGAAGGSLTLPTVGSPALMTALETGRREVAGGTVLTILTAISGWTGAEASIAGDPGRALESDAAARLRRARSLRIAGAGTVEAIRARLLEVAGVDSVRIYENVTDVVDPVTGILAHSFECVVEGGLAADIARAIWLAKPAGIRTHGNTSELVTDTQGLAHEIRFSRVVPVTMHVRVNVTALYTEEALPANAATLIQNAVVAAGEALGVGADVIAARFLGPIFAAVSGILSMDVTVERDAPADPPPADATEPIATTERGRFATSRVVVILPP